MTQSKANPNVPQLHSLDTNSFEQLVNSLALRVLGAGHTNFGPGRDGGRDGYFEGSAAYPSSSEQWSGTWYIQSKFHAPHLSTDSQAWLLKQIESELDAFENNSDRKFPDIWIVASNIDPSGVPETGCFDKARKLVASRRPSLEKKFHIWGGKKIIDFLVDYPNIAEQYGHFLTPGNILSALYKKLADDEVAVSDIIRYLVIREFETHQYTKLDQAGSQSDTRPGVHELFVDLPLRSIRHQYEGLVLNDLLKTSSRNHRPSQNTNLQGWDLWEQHPSRARVWFILGGPGQGKSTTGQYFSQLQRAHLILQWQGSPIKPALKDVAISIKKEASLKQHWLASARIPVTVELREYAKWYGDQSSTSPRGLLTYFGIKIQKYLQRPVGAHSFKRALREQSWFFAFDGLDEVPSDVKLEVSNEIIEFIDDVAYECDCDALFVCTSRPQGYAGQLDQLTSMRGQLCELGKDKALECAKPVIAIGRSAEETQRGFDILKSAIESSSVASLMQTPLQTHIMAVVVRDGRRPPERRWALFENFYQVIKSREANRDLPDVRLARLLREENKLLKAVHNRIGYALHSAAERSQGAQTSISRQQFRSIAEAVVEIMKSEDKPEMVKTLEEATETRLVLVNTPDDGESLRYDIRQLQEFFAAEYFYDTVPIQQFRERISIAGGDSHWREVMHFLFSAMIELARMSEIHEIVDLLQNLNSGGTCENLRDLHRRLAIGASLTAKLLQDGVLEQDKRIRIKFEQSFEPLLSTNENSILFPLETITLSQSRLWLCTLCKKQIEEAVPTESVGAAVILLWNLTLEDTGAESALDTLLKMPTSYKNEILTAAHNRYHNESVGNFHLKFIFKETLSENWFEGRRLPLSYLEDHYFLSESPLNNVCKSLSISDLEIDIIKILLTSHPGPEEKPSVKRIGNIDLTFSKRPKLAAIWEEQFGRNTILVPEAGRGFLSFAIALVRFNFHPTESSLITLINHLEIAPLQIWKNISYSIQRYLPREIVDFIIEGKKNSIESLLNKIESDNSLILDYSFTRKKSSNPMDLRDFDQLCNLSPMLGSMVYFDQTLEKDASIFADRLLCSLEQDTSLVCHIGIARWGFLEKFVSRTNQIRARIILRIAYPKEYAKIQKWGRNRGVAPIFPLELDQDNYLLYYIILEEFSLYFFTGSGVRHKSSRKPLSHEECRKQILDTIGKFINLTTISIQSGDNLEPIDRGLIMITLALLRKIEEKTLLDELYSILEVTRDCGFLTIVIGLLGLSSGPPSHNSQYFISKILYLFRESYEHRDEISDILSIWREGSSFPVNRSNQQVWEYS